MKNAMAAVLDMTNLRDIIDHDKELERELIQNFYTCYHTCISDLESSLDTMDAVQWCNAAHALKGIAYNLGAEQLGSLCLKSEQAHLADAPEKSILFLEIKTAYAAVATALARIDYN
jgi:HPt (histidine-containing phosphotransfer) domain-containing protein